MQVLPGEHIYLTRGTWHLRRPTKDYHETGRASTRILTDEPGSCAAISAALYWYSPDLARHGDSQCCEMVRWVQEVC